MKRILIYTLPVILVLITPFFWSDNLYNGLITAKQIWFYAAMALLILVAAIDVLFNKKNLSFSFNIIDVSLLAFYIYFFIRTALTPYTPLIYNPRFLNYSLLLVFYFIVKFIASGPDLNKDTGRLIDVKKKREVISSAEILVLVLISTGLVQAIWGLLQLYGITRSFHSGFKISGTFFNPAPYALYLATIFPLALGNLLGIKELKRIKELKNERILLMKELKNEGIKELLVSSNSLIFSFLHSLIIRLTYYLSLLTVIAIILVLPATMNRASWLGIVIGSLFVLNYRYNLFSQTKFYLHNTSRKLFAFAIVIMVIGLSAAGLYFLKKGSSVGRLLIWEVTINKIVEKPLFGQGVGRFEAEYNNWQAEYFKAHPSEMEGPKGMVAGNTKYCFNEYLEMTSELGLMGLFLFLMVISSVFLSIRARTLTTNDGRGPNDAKRMTPQANDNSLIPSFLNSFIIIIPSLISLLVMALISFPFYSLPTLIVFFLLLAILSSHIEAINISDKFFHFSNTRIFISSPTTQPHNPSTFKFFHHSNIPIFHPSTIKLLNFSSLLSISILLLLLTFRQYKAYYIFDEAVMLFQTGSYEEACKSFSEVYIPLQYTGSYLQYYGKALYLYEEYPKSIEMLERAAHFTSDEILFTTLGDTYKALKRYSEAEEAYRHASFMVPHKLFPLYLLTNLYSETGQNAKALETAKQILSKEIKVESNATEEITQAMRKLIEKIESDKDGF